MFYRTLAKMVAVLPSRFKYRMSGIKPFYTFLMGLGQSVVRVQTSAGVFCWKIDRLTSQEFLLGSYEPHMQRLFQKFVREGGIVYDVGAHAGFHSIFCGLLVGTSGRVIAFEPGAEEYRSTKQQITLNPKLPISLFPYALSDRCGMVGFDISKGTSRARVSEAGKMNVEARTIDLLVVEKQIPPPNVIKIDVEGHDLHVLRGASETLRRYKPVILCDYNTGITLAGLNGLLAPLGYVVTEEPPFVAVPVTVE